MFKCPICEQSYATKMGTLWRHLREACEGPISSDTSDISSDDDMDIDEVQEIQGFEEEVTNEEEEEEEEQEEEEDEGEKGRLEAEASGLWTALGNMAKRIHEADTEGNDDLKEEVRGWNYAQATVSGRLHEIYQRLAELND